MNKRDAQGFLRVRCNSRHAEHLVPFSCKRHGFCPSCGARRMVESAALMVDEVFPEHPVWQWVLNVRYPLRFPLAGSPVILNEVLGITAHLIGKADLPGRRPIPSQFSVRNNKQGASAQRRLNPYRFLQSCQ